MAVHDNGQRLSDVSLGEVIENASAFTADLECDNWLAACAVLSLLRRKQITAVKCSLAVDYDNSRKLLDSIRIG